RKGDISAHLAAFRQDLRAAHNPERAANEKRYLKSPYKFFGVTVPFTDRLARDFRKTHKDASREEIFALAEALWSSEYHQEKTLAIKLLEKYPHHLDIRSMPLIERMLSECTGWDHVDGIAIHLVDAVLRKDDGAFAYLTKWSKSENFWMRRAALISQILLFREGRGDRQLFFGLAEAMIREKEFFIRKAIGWTVRELSKADPQAACDFLLRVKDRASGLTLREGAKRLPGEMKKRVMNAPRLPIGSSGGEVL
ncbi:MAG TPA: DNA alkylation repair protein, partial [Dissulfurispiraceae bacterium]|nr:DNA alkylation repair protein [Dissulfurispiraceae bacterium]